MAKRKLDKETRDALSAAKKMIEDVARADGNEAETRKRVERIIESLMGYDVFKHITREHAVRGTGTTEHCDFAFHIEEGETAKPVIMVELKRVNIDLAPKHLRQVSSYAINKGCEWLILTNGRQWELHHVSFGQPPRVKLIESWNLLEDDPAVLVDKFALVGYRNVRKGGLEELWQKTNILTPRNVLAAMLSEQSIIVIRRQLRKMAGILVSPEETVGGIRRLLNEAALAEMENMKISLPERRRRRRKTARTGENQGKEPVKLAVVAPDDVARPCEESEE